MAAKKPDLDEGITVKVYSKANDVTFIGRIQDILNSQFTIQVIEPEIFRDKIHFVFYNDDWSVIDY